MEILSTQVREDKLIYLNKDVYFQMFCQCIWGNFFSFGNSNPSSFLKQNLMSPG